MIAKVGKGALLLRRLVASTGLRVRLRQAQAARNDAFLVILCSLERMRHNKELESISLSPSKRTELKKAITSA